MAPRGFRDMTASPRFVLRVARPTAGDPTPDRLLLEALARAGRGRLPDAPTALGAMLGADRLTIMRHRDQLVAEGAVQRVGGFLVPVATWRGSAGDGSIRRDAMPVELLGHAWTRPALLRSAAVVFGEAARRERAGIASRDELCARARCSPRLLADARSRLVAVGAIVLEPAWIPTARGRKQSIRMRRSDTAPLVESAPDLPAPSSITREPQSEGPRVSPGNRSSVTAEPQPVSPGNRPHTSPKEKAPHSACALGDGPLLLRTGDGPAAAARLNAARAAAATLLLDAERVGALLQRRPYEAALELLAVAGVLDVVPGATSDRAARAITRKRTALAVRIARADAVSELLLVIGDVLLDPKARSLGAVVASRLGPLLAGRPGEAISEARRSWSLGEMLTAVVSCQQGGPPFEKDCAPGGMRQECDAPPRFRSATPQPPPAAIAPELPPAVDRTVDRRSMSMLAGAARAGDWRRARGRLQSLGRVDLEGLAAVVAGKAGIDVEVVREGFGLAALVAPSPLPLRASPAC